MDWADYNGDVPVKKALRSVLSWRTASWWRNTSAWSMRVDPMNVRKGKGTQLGIRGDSKTVVD